jgi:hypothetical protein
MINKQRIEEAALRYEDQELHIPSRYRQDSFSESFTVANLLVAQEYEKEIQQLKHRLEVAVEASNSILMVSLPPHDVSGRAMWDKAKEALAKISAESDKIT